MRRPTICISFFITQFHVTDMHKYLKLLDKKLVSREAGGQLKKIKFKPIIPVMKNLIF
jgi:hypothetical protein